MFSFAKIDIQKRKFLKSNQIKLDNLNLFNQLKTGLKTKDALVNLFESASLRILSANGITSKFQFNIFKNNQTFPI